jgi:chemotaxis protein MotB
VEISADLLFASGQAYPAPEAQATLRQLADILRRFPNPLRVEGHTDDRPISNLVFPSNWELSAARAISVVKFLAEQGIPPERLSEGKQELRIASHRNETRRIGVEERPNDPEVLGNV